MMVSKSHEMVNLTMALFAKFWVNGNQDELLSRLGWNPPRSFGSMEIRMNSYHDLVETLKISNAAEPEELGSWAG
jgi:hypothetical protein